MPRKAKSDKKTVVHKSDRSWGGKVILTGEPEKKGKPNFAVEGTMGPNWKTASFETHWNEAEQRQEGVCFRDGHEIARFIIKPSKSRK
jgi:hypothetical protein